MLLAYAYMLYQIMDKTVVGLVVRMRITSLDYVILVMTSNYPRIIKT